MLRQGDCPEGVSAGHITGLGAAFTVALTYTDGVPNARNGATAVEVAGKGAVILVADNGAAAVDVGDDDAIGDAVGDGVAQVFAHDAAEVHAAGRVRHGEASAADAAAHGTGLV